MTDIEKRARELLASEYEADGCMQLARMIRSGAVTDPVFGSVKIMRAMRAITAALTPPEGYVLVPVAVAKDADRYQWLRAKAGDSPEEFEVVADAAFAAHYGCPENLDINVDAAMLASRPEVLGG